MFRKYPSVRCLNIESDCSYSGQWVRECAKTLDSLQIPPCGHRAKEQGAMVKVFASCQHDQQAKVLCYSVKGVKSREDGSIRAYARKLGETQTSKWFDSTRLVCCRSPDSPCPKNTFQHLTWENAVEESFKPLKVKTTEGSRDMWCFLLLHKPGEAYRKEFESEREKNPNLQLSDWGYILESGEGKNSPRVAGDHVRHRSFYVAQ